MKRPTNSVTKRQKQVLTLLQQGKSIKQIAAALNISPRTADSHLVNIYAALGVYGWYQALRVAQEQGILAPLDVNSAGTLAQLELTVREKEMLAWALKGYKAAQTAECLFVSPHTVNSHLGSAYRKLKLHSVKEAFALLKRTGLLADLLHPPQWSQGLLPHISPVAAAPRAESAGCECAVPATARCVAVRGRVI